MTEGTYLLALPPQSIWESQGRAPAGVKVLAVILSLSLPVARGIVMHQQEGWQEKLKNYLAFSPFHGK
jgi:hypothetical protein